MKNPRNPVFGIIGAGGIGRIHMDAILAAGLPVAAVADPATAALEKAGQLFPHARLYEDWRELLQDEEVTAVNICTISSLHLEILREAVRQGKNVLCEKTMTTSAAQAREALEINLSPGQVAQVGYMKRFFPASIWAKEHLPEIGQPLCAVVRSYQGGGENETIFDDANWKGSPGNPSRVRTIVSAGMLNMAGSHMLDMAAWLLGLPEKVTCQTWAPDGYDAELHAQALFLMQSKALVQLQVCVSTFHKTGLYENGWDEFIQIDGTKGRMEIYYPTWNRPQDHPAKVRLYRESTQTWEEPAMPIVNPFQLEIEAFAQSCRDGLPASPSLHDGAVVDCLIDTCYQSAEQAATLNFAV